MRVHPREHRDDAIVEQYIEGRELYVGVLGNERLQRASRSGSCSSRTCPRSAGTIATERLKWSLSYQKKHGIVSGEAKDLPDGLERRSAGSASASTARLMLTGYARIDLRLDATGEIYVLEANPNPQLAYGEDFAESAEKTGLDYGPLLQRIVALGLAWEPGYLG